MVSRKTPVVAPLIPRVKRVGWWREVFGYSADCCWSSPEDDGAVSDLVGLLSLEMLRHVMFSLDGLIVCILTIKCPKCVANVGYSWERDARHFILVLAI
jgi:hypothetical protein